MESIIKYKNHFDRELAFKLMDLEADRRKIINKVIIAKLLNIITLVVFLSIFVGFLNAFPFDEFEMPFITYIFQGFFYVVLSIVVFGIMLEAIRYLLEVKGAKELLKNKRLIYIFAAIGSIISISVAWALGKFYLGVEIKSALFFIKYFMAFFILLFLGFLAYLFGMYEKKFINAFKSEILPILLTYFNPALKFDQSTYVKQNLFEESSIFRFSEIYSYKGSDKVLGSYGQGNFEFSHLDVKQKTTTKSSGSTETKISQLFIGLFYVADFNKPFSGRTIIYPDYARQALGGQFGEMFNKVFEFDNNHLVTLEDVEFEKEFAVYSTDQVEARYILSPAMIERIKTIRWKLDRNIYLSFINNKLYVAIPNGSDSLSPIIFNNITNFESVEPIYQLIGTLLEIALDLQLNTRIWGDVNT